MKAVLTRKVVTSRRAPPALSFESIQEALPWLVSLVLRGRSKLAGTRLRLKFPPRLNYLFLW